LSLTTISVRASVCQTDSGVMNGNVNVAGNPPTCVGFAMSRRSTTSVFVTKVSGAPISTRKIFLKRAAGPFASSRSMTRYA